VREDRMQFKPNLPENVKAWLAGEAARNLSSQSAEVILALLEKMARGSEAESGAEPAIQEPVSSILSFASAIGGSKNVDGVD
jgi:hypothetical protein